MAKQTTGDELSIKIKHALSAGAPSTLIRNASSVFVQPLSKAIVRIAGLITWLHRCGDLIDRAILPDPCNFPEIAEARGADREAADVGQGY
jgi:hypothetical protein